MTELELCELEQLAKRGGAVPASMLVRRVRELDRLRLDLFETCAKLAGSEADLAAEREKRQWWESESTEWARLYTAIVADRDTEHRARMRLEAELVAQREAARLMREALERYAGQGNIWHHTTLRAQAALAAADKVLQE